MHKIKIYKKQLKKLYDINLLWYFIHIIKKLYIIAIIEI